MRKKVLSVLLCICVILSFIPLSVIAIGNSVYMSVTEGLRNVSNVGDMFTVDDKTYTYGGDVQETGLDWYFAEDNEAMPLPESLTVYKAGYAYITAEMWDDGGKLSGDQRTILLTMNDSDLEPSEKEAIRSSYNMEITLVGKNSIGVDNDHSSGIFVARSSGTSLSFKGEGSLFVRSGDNSIKCLNTGETGYATVAFDDDVTVYATGKTYGIYVDGDVSVSDTAVVRSINNSKGIPASFVTGTVSGILKNYRDVSHSVLSSDEFNTQEKNYVAGPGTIKWEPEVSEGILVSGTLTFDNATINNVTLDNGGIINLPNVPVNVVFNGQNYIQNSLTRNVNDLYDFNPEYFTSVFNVKNDVTFTATEGSALGTNNSGGRTYGIYAEDNENTIDLKITGDGIILFFVSGVDQNGIYNPHGNVCIDGSGNFMFTAYDIYKKKSIICKNLKMYDKTIETLPGDIIAENATIGNLVIPMGKSLNLSSVSHVTIDKPISMDGNLVLPKYSSLDEGVRYLSGKGIVEIGHYYDDTNKKNDYEYYESGKGGTYSAFTTSGDTLHTLHHTLDFTGNSINESWCTSATLENDGFSCNQNADSSYTLTLGNLYIISDDAATPAVKLPETVDLCVTLNDGMSTYIVSQNAAMLFPSSADETEHNITINGKGNLLLNSPSYADCLLFCQPVTINNGNISIYNGLNAIHAGKDLTINDGSIYINNSTEGICSEEDLTINGGTIDLVGSQAIYGHSYVFGLSAEKDFIVNGGTISVTQAGIGLQANNGITINDGKFNIAASTCIRVYNKPIVINGGDIFIDGRSDGILSEKEIRFCGGKAFFNAASSIVQSSTGIEFDHVTSYDVYPIWGGSFYAIMEHGGAGSMKNFPINTKPTLTCTEKSDTNMSFKAEVSDSAKNNIVSYKLSEKNGKCSPLTSTDGIFKVTGLNPNVEYQFTVVTTDKNENESDPSEICTVLSDKTDLKNAVVTYENPNFIYNGKSQVPEITVKSNGKTLTENKDYELKFTNTNGGKDNTVNVGTISITVSASKGSDYCGTNMTKSYMITPAELTVTGLKANDRYFDDTNSIALTGGTLTGVCGDDDVTAEMPKVGTVANKSIEKNKAVTIPKIEIKGTDISNYTLIQPTGLTASINQYEAQKGTCYTVTSNDWINKDFVVTAKPGFKLSKTNTTDGTWVDSFTDSDETEADSIKFYVKNTANGAISQMVTEGYKIGKTAPTGTISIAENHWTKFLNTITFGLLFKDTQNVTIVPDSDVSGIAKIEYNSSDKQLTLDEVKDLTDWHEGNLIKVTAEDQKQFIYYARITDGAGNVTYLSTDGAEFDTSAPTITGVQNGGTYYTTQSVTVTDKNPKSITLNGETCTSPIILKGNVDAAYTIVAVDQLGNTVTYTVTMKPIASLTSSIDSIETGTVKSSDNTTVNSVLVNLGNINTINATEDEKNEINKDTTKCNDLIETITNTKAKLHSLDEKVNSLSTDSIKSSDKTDVAKLLNDIGVLLSGDNATEAEKTALEDLKAKSDKLDEKIKEVSEKTNLTQTKISSAKGISRDSVKLNDKQNIKLAIDSLQNLKKNYEKNYTEMELKDINDQLNDMEGAYEAIENAEKVISLIANLPNSSDTTTKDFNVINTAKVAYDSLTENEKAMVGSASAEILNNDVKTVNERISIAEREEMLKSPLTGDTSRVNLLISLLLITGGIVIIYGVLRTNKKKDIH